MNSQFYTLINKRNILRLNYRNKETRDIYKKRKINVELVY